MSHFTSKDPYPTLLIMREITEKLMCRDGGEETTLSSNHHWPERVTSASLWIQDSASSVTGNFDQKAMHVAPWPMENMISGLKLLASELNIRMVFHSFLACLLGGHHPSYRCGWHFLVKHDGFPMDFRKPLSSCTRSWEGWHCLSQHSRILWNPSEKPVPMFPSQCS